MPVVRRYFSICNSVGGASAYVRFKEENLSVSAYKYTSIQSENRARNATHFAFNFSLHISRFIFRIAKARRNSKELTTFSGSVLVCIFVSFCAVRTLCADL